MATSARRRSGEKYNFCNNLNYNNMQKTYRLSINMWALDTDADHILHRIGSKDYSEIRHTIVKDPEEWEEIAVADIRAAEQAREAKATYKSRVISLIRQRYDNDDETAILRQRDTKPDEFVAYNTYVEQCKAQAKLEESK